MASSSRRTASSASVTRAAASTAAPRATSARFASAFATDPLGSPGSRLPSATSNSSSRSTYASLSSSSTKPGSNALHFSANARLHTYITPLLPSTTNTARVGCGTICATPLEASAPTATARTSPLSRRQTCSSCAPPDDAATAKRASCENAAALHCPRELALAKTREGVNTPFFCRLVSFTSRDGSCTSSSSSSPSSSSAPSANAFAGGALFSTFAGVSSFAFALSSTS